MIRSAVVGRGAAVRDGRLPGLRPVLRAHQRRPVRRDRDPDDLPRQDGVPQRRRGLRLRDGGRAHGHRAGRRASRTRGSRGAGRGRGRAGRRAGDRRGSSGSDAGLPDDRRVPPGCSVAASLLLAIVFFFPMVWMVLSSFKTEQRTSSRRRSRCRRRSTCRPLGRGVGGGNLGQYALNSAIVTAVVGDADPAVRVGRGVRVQPLPVPGPRACVLGLFALGLLLPLQSLLHRPVEHVHAAGASPTPGSR